MQYEHPDFERITVDPKVCFGKPCIRGTRMPVSSVLSYLSSGMTIEEMLKEFDRLTREDILEAFAFSASMMNDRIIPMHRKAS